MNRKSIYYSGNVQGVGFRIKAQRVARDFDVMGYVTNLPDGRVQIVVDGHEGQVDAFLEAIARTLSHHIFNSETCVDRSKVPLAGFEIRY